MSLTRSIAALLVAAGALCAHAAADTVTVYVFNYGYSQNDPDHGGSLPDNPTINVGDTIHWVLANGFHTVDSCEGMTEEFSSGYLTDVGQTFDHTFTTAGAFGYYCILHGFDAGNGVGGGMAGSVTVNPSTPSCTADIGVSGGGPGHDGLLDNNDFIAFIDYFFAQDPIADMGTAGGLPGHDQLWDNNDFIAFISHFFEGC